jgi:hypothetical protein
MLFDRWNKRQNERLWQDAEGIVGAHPDDGPRGLG